MNRTGLELRLSGRWCRPRTRLQDIVVISGELLERWTNERINGVFHRVSLKGSHEDRVSLVWFGAQVVQPTNNIPLQPLLEPGERPRFRAKPVKDILNERIGLLNPVRKAPL